MESGGNRYPLMFVHPNAGYFSDKYERNNKKGGVKAMKCFPTCTLVNREHGRGTLCVDSVVISIDMPRILKYFNYQPIEVIGIGRFVTDLDVMKNDSYFGDFNIYNDGAKYDKENIIKLLRSKDVPFNPEIFAELDNQNRLTFSSRGWHYGWSGGRYKVHQPHRFEAIAFARLTSIPDEKFICIGSIQGSNFEIFSSRRADPNDKLRRRVSRGLGALNAAERFASEKEEEILRQLGSSSSPKNESENDGDVDEEFVQQLEQQQQYYQDHQNFPRADGFNDPLLKVGKRAAMNEFSKAIVSATKKNKLTLTSEIQPPQKRGKKPVKPSPALNNISPLINQHDFGNPKKETFSNPLAFNYGNTSDPATLAAMLVLQQNNSSIPHRNEDSLIGDIIMNPFSTTQPQINLFPFQNQVANNNASYFAPTAGFTNSSNFANSLSQGMFSNNANSLDDENMDQVDSLLNDFVSLEQAFGIEFENAACSDDKLNEPITIPIADTKYYPSKGQGMYKNEFHNPMQQPPEMDKHSSPGAYSSDEIISAEDDEEFFQNIDIFQRLSSNPSSKEENDNENNNALPSLPDQIITKVIDVIPSKTSKNTVASSQIKVLDDVIKPAVKEISAAAEKVAENISETTKEVIDESKITKIKDLLNQYTAWKNVKMRFSKLKYRAMKVMKRQQSYFFPKGVVIV